MAKKPQIPPVRLPKEMRGLQVAMDAIREQIQIDQGERGHPLDRAVKVRDLVEAGVAEYQLHQSGRAAKVVAPGKVVNLNQPPSPSGFSAAGTTSNVYLLWDAPNYDYHAYAEIWRSTQDNLATAVLLGARPAYRSYVDPVDAGQTYYYWMRFVSQAGKHSGYNATAGTQASTALPVQHLLETLNDKITSNELVQELREPIELIPSISTALGEETTNRIASDAAEAQARADAIQAEVDARIAAINQERSTSAYEISVEQTTRAQKLAEEAQARVGGIQAEADARTTEITNLNTQIQTDLQAVQQASIAAIQQESQERTADIGAESLERIKGFRALQSIESLTGTDARELKSLARIANEEMARMQQYQELSAVYQTLNSTTSAEIVRLDEAVATETGARATAITNLNAQFQIDLQTVQQAAVTEAINVITTDDDVIAAVITKISAADTTGWATTTYVDENAVTPLNAVTTRVNTLESQYQALGSTYLSQASFTAWQQTYTTDQSATAERLESVETSVSDASTQLASKASTSDLTQLQNTIYNSQVSQFGQLSARFAVLQVDIDARATKTELTQAISDTRGASVSEFTNIDAAFSDVTNSLSTKASTDDVTTIAADLEKASIERTTQAVTAMTYGDVSALTEQILSIQQTVNAEQSLITKMDRMTAEYKTGISTTTAEINRVETTLSNELGATVETLAQFQASYANDKTNTLATKSELNQAKTDVLGAQVSEFSELNAQFAVLQDDIDTRATTAALSSAIATEQEARVTLSQSIDTQFTAKQTDIDTRATKTELTDAISTEQEARTTQFSNTQSQLTGINNTLNTKASISELEETAATLEEVTTNQLNVTAVALQQDNFDAQAATIKSIAQTAKSNSVQVQRLDRMESEYNTGISASFAEITQTKNLLTSDIESLAETVTSHKAGYETDKQTSLATKTEVEQAKTDVKGAAVTDFTQIQTAFNNQQSDIDSRATRVELTDAISNEQQSRLTLSNSINTEFADQQNNINTRATKTELTDAITTEQGARTALSNSINTQFSSLQEDIDTRATKTELTQAESDIKSSSVTDFTQINSEFQAKQSDIDTRATKTELSEAISSESSARSTAISQLSTTVGANTATIQTQSESINGLKTNWSVKFAVGADGVQRVSGFGLSADGASTSAHFDVDAFSISKPGADKLDFTVVDARDANGALIQNPDGSQKRMVVMDAAKIVNLQVTNAMIESLTADKITAGKINAAISMMAATLYGGAMRLGVGGVVRDNENNVATGYGTVIDGDGAYTSDAYFRVGNNDQYILWNGSVFEISAILNAATIDSEKTKVKSIKNDSAGPITTVLERSNAVQIAAGSTVYDEWGNPTVTHATNDGEIGTLYLPQSNDVSKSKISNPNSVFVTLTCFIRYRRMAVGIFYQITRLDGSTSSLQFIEMDSLFKLQVCSYAESENKTSVNVNVPLFGPNGIANVETDVSITFWFRELSLVSGAYFYTIGSTYMIYNNL